MLKAEKYCVEMHNTRHFALTFFTNECIYIQIK